MEWDNAGREEGAHATRRTAHHVSIGTNGALGCERRRAAQVGVGTVMLKRTPIRAAAALATIVAFVASVGAPFKWY